MKVYLAVVFALVLMNCVQAWSFICCAKKGACDGSKYTKECCQHEWGKTCWGMSREDAEYGAACCRELGQPSLVYYVATNKYNLIKVSR